MKSLVIEQHLFILDMAKLILKSNELGFIVTGGELFRSLEQQEIHVKAGRSKTMNSMHMKRCAIDLNIFKNGQLCTLEEIEPLGVFWESLSPLNRWGGRFKSLKDGPHFERSVS